MKVYLFFFVYTFIVYTFTPIINHQNIIKMKQRIEIYYNYYKARANNQFLTVEFLENEIKDNENNSPEEIENYKTLYLIEAEKLELLRQIKSDLHSLMTPTKKD